jgi:hypothetical protein
LSRTATRSPLAILAGLGAVVALAIAAPQLVTKGAATSPDPSRPIRIPKVRESDGHVQFYVQWTPGRYNRTVKLTNLTVNGQRYLVNQYPTAITPRRWPSIDEWESPRIPIPHDQPREAVTAHVDITVTRPKGYTGRLITGCIIKINGDNGPGYSGVRGDGTNKMDRSQPKTFFYRCQIPVPLRR